MCVCSKTVLIRTSRLTSPEKAWPLRRCSEPCPSSLPKCNLISSSRWLYVIGPPEMFTKCSLSRRSETWRPVLYIVPPTYIYTKRHKRKQRFSDCLEVLYLCLLLSTVWQGYAKDLHIIKTVCVWISPLLQLIISPTYCRFRVGDLSPKFTSKFASGKFLLFRVGLCTWLN